MTKQLVREIVPTAPADAGRYLRAAVDTALGELDAPPTKDMVRRLAAALRTGLAWTAATGGTCQVAPAAEAVRHAARSLVAGDHEQARTALLAARAGLRPVTTPS